jgi:chromosome segregation ATPase
MGVFETLVEFDRKQQSYIDTLEKSVSELAEKHADALRDYDECKRELNNLQEKYNRLQLHYDDISESYNRLWTDYTYMMD